MSNPVEGQIRGGTLISDKYGVVLERGGLPWRIEKDGDGPVEVYCQGQWIELVK